MTFEELNKEIKGLINKNSIFQVYANSDCTLYVNSNNIYVSNKPISKFAFRDHKSLDSLDGVDFWNISDEELNTILNSFELRRLF